MCVCAEVYATHFVLMKLFLNDIFTQHKKVVTPFSAAVCMCVHLSVCHNCTLQSIPENC